jgi:hypothetical protein
MVGIHHDTVMRLGIRMGVGCQRITNRKMRPLKASLIQVDEFLFFIGKKQKNADATDGRAGQGDVWAWIALDSETKVIPTFAVGEQRGRRGSAVRRSAGNSARGFSGNRRKGGDCCRREETCRKVNW